MPFRLTIERLRTLVLVTAGLLIAALVASLAVSKWKSRLNLTEIPKRLGAEIQQEANGVTYTQARGGHTLFKIHAGKVVQLKEGGKALLHDVQIELYGEDGSRVDRIAGGEFEYDQKAGVATAAGPVEITIMRPGTAPAVAPRASADQAAKGTGPGTVLGGAAQTVAAGQIEVKTSGLTFNQKTGTATTEQRVEFALAQGEGSATGAQFDSDHGQLVLDHDVEMTVRRATGSRSGPKVEDVKIRARHAEFERGSLIGTMAGAAASYRGGQATAGDAKVLFRQDGSAVRLDATSGFTLATASGAHVAAPQGWLEFDEKNHPQRGHLEGGVTLDSVTGGRQSHGSAPVAELEFSPLGDLRHAHMERGVVMHSEEDAAGAHISRDWRSPIADVAFRAGAKSKTEIASVFGQGGVTMTGQTRRGDGGMTPSRISADQVTAEFAADQQLKHVTGTGHASVEQTTATGTVQTTTGDRLEADLMQRPAQGSTNGQAQAAAGQIESAKVDGNVVMTQQPATKPGQAPQPLLRATAAHAVYEGAWLHLTGNPRVVNGGMEMTADRVDVAQGAGNTNRANAAGNAVGASGRVQQAGNADGDAFAHGNVKATWVNDGRDKSAAGSTGGSSSGTVGLGGQTPAHVIASEAEFRQATGEATFRGQARLWQDANSVAAPVIVLDRTKRTLAAHGTGTGTGAGDPVKLVLLSAGGAPGTASGAKSDSGKQAGEGKQGTPAVIRVRGGDLLYTDTMRKAVLHAVPGGTVTAETGTATSNSDAVELTLLPAGSHAEKNAGGAQVDRMTARGNVVLTSQGRQGIGEQLTYTGQTGQYVLTGTTGKPPQMSDPERGTVTGNALIFNSRDDSVSIEGAGEKTRTTTHAPAKSDGK
jgi:lipopolysaccharide export system protein LptA